MGFPVGIGIPWVSYGNGIKTPTWEWEWGGVGMKVDGNGNDPYFHGKFPTDFFAVSGLSLGCRLDQSCIC